MRKRYSANATCLTMVPGRPKPLVPLPSSSWRRKPSAQARSGCCCAAGPGAAIQRRVMALPSLAALGSDGDAHHGGPARASQPASTACTDNQLAGLANPATQNLQSLTRSGRPERPASEVASLGRPHAGRARPRAARSGTRTGEPLLAQGQGTPGSAWAGLKLAPTTKLCLRPCLRCRSRGQAPREKIGGAARTEASGHFFLRYRCAEGFLGSLAAAANGLTGSRRPTLGFRAPLQSCGVM
jgi:hypothetical protein